MAKAKSKARQITPNTIKRLFALSGNCCAYNHDGNNCQVQIVQASSQDLITQICHIEAAEPGGQRFNPYSNDDYRRSFANLVLLCPNHHKVTDDIITYTPEVLLKMKTDHEAKMLKAISTEGHMTKYPSALNMVVSSLGNQMYDEGIEDEPNTAPDPEDKMTFNNVVLYRPTIEIYKVYQGKLNKVYEEIERHGSTKKAIVLRNINSLYLKAKGKYSTLDLVKANADQIFKEVENGMWGIVSATSNSDDGLAYEAIQMSISIILVDAFMRCEILEEPVIL